MNNAVIVVGNPALNGALVTPSQSNPEFGSIRFDSTGFSIGALITKEHRVAFKSGRIAELEEFIKAANLSEGSVIKGAKIVHKESFTPFFAGQQPKKRLGPNREVTGNVTSSGKLVYRDTQLSFNLDEQDVLLPTDRIAVAMNTAPLVDNMQQQA